MSRRSVVAKKQTKNKKLLDKHSCSNTRTYDLSPFHARTVLCISTSCAPDATRGMPYQTQSVRKSTATVEDMGIERPYLAPHDRFP